MNSSPHFSKVLIFEAIFQVCRAWMFDDHIQRLSRVTLYEYEKFALNLTVLNEAVNVWGELFFQTLHSYQAESCTEWRNRRLWSVWSSGWRSADLQWRVCWSLPIRWAKAELYCAAQTAQQWDRSSVHSVMHIQGFYIRSLDLSSLQSYCKGCISFILNILTWLRVWIFSVSHDWIQFQFRFLGSRFNSKSILNSKWYTTKKQFLIQ